MLVNMILCLHGNDAIMIILYATMKNTKESNITSKPIQKIEIMILYAKKYNILMILMLNVLMLNDFNA